MSLGAGVIVGAEVIVGEIVDGQDVGAGLKVGCGSVGLYVCVLVGGFDGAGDTLGDAEGCGVVGP